MLKTAPPLGNVQEEPLRTLFMLTSMPVGGAETLLVNLIRHLDRGRLLPEICCLKERGPLGEELASEVPVHQKLIRSKYDLGVVGRLSRLIRDRRIKAVVTVGAGDKMFWGRLAAWRARVPVVAAALHSTGWPDGIGRLNRMLTPITDAFIGVADPHGKHLVSVERLPARKVFVIPNGIDTDRYRPLPFASDAKSLADARRNLGLPVEHPLCCIVAALRPEKNHARFLRMAAGVRSELPDAQFVIVGDGPFRADLERLADQLRLREAVHFLGCRSDVHKILPVCDVFALTSDNEAAPVSILEAMACGLPVIAPDVGSIGEMVVEGVCGYRVSPSHESLFAERVLTVMSDKGLGERLGQEGRAIVVEEGSLGVMVRGYENLLLDIYLQKANRGSRLPK